ncbi:SCO6745 family protein [Streptomyces scabiei]|uniref:SCO6745 family protein n=1 Tax=Streptomyces scabiei TaxID=1930 RepID=UPI0006913654|nr:hypothetical protein [Streptomyces scabiei]
MDFSHCPRLAELGESAVDVARKIAVHEDECEAGNDLCPENRAALRLTGPANGPHAMKAPVARGGAGRSWGEQVTGEAALRALLGDTVDGPELAEAAPLAAAAAAACDGPGCALGAGMAFLALPQAPHLALRQAVTALCEYRGDGQVGVLTHAEFDDVEALVRITAAGGAVPESNRARQGWTDEEWAEGERRLRDRGMLDSAGGRTPGGRAARAAVEAFTDLFASAPWKALGAQRT